MLRPFTGSIQDLHMIVSRPFFSAGKDKICEICEICGFYPGWGGTREASNESVTEGHLDGSRPA